MRYMVFSAPEGYGDRMRLQKYRIFAALILAGLPVLTYAPDSLAAPPEETPDWFQQSALPGHSITMLPTGDHLTEARHDLLERATRSIYISTYMFIPDEAGLDIAYRLCAKAKEGIDVRLYADSYGSKPLKKRKYVEWLQRCGVRVLFFNPPRWGVLDLMQVMHEKLFIVDGTHVLVGGNGYDNRYRRASRNSKIWHDIEFKVAGPVACWYHYQFIETWKQGTERTIIAETSISESTSSEAPSSPKPAFTPEELSRFFGIDQFTSCEPVVSGTSNIAPFYGSPMFSKERPLLKAHLNALKASKRRVVFYSPYFIPHEDFAAALLAARKRGVEVLIITNSPESSDEKAAITLGMMYKVRRLMRAGVKIYLWQEPSTMHRKGGIYDDRWAYFGSDNLDRRAQEYSTETIAFTDDEHVLQQLHAEYEQDLLLSIPMTREFMQKFALEAPLLTRWAARILLKYM
ncbi:MAG TPA: hypothetical protein DIS93_01765 [Bdellovibrionales bacterium]|nr:hypothetical protein [Bdellovibrionales bacterium]